LPSSPNNNPFRLHKAALQPLQRTLNQKESTALFTQLESFDQKDFTIFLHHQGLAQMWLPFLLQQETLPNKWEETLKDLKHDALNIAA